MLATGSGIIQVAGDLSVVLTAAPTELGQDTAAAKLSQEERLQLSVLTDEVVAAEAGLVTAKVVRSALNAHIGVKTVAAMTSADFPKATLYLSGWKACAAGKEISSDAAVAQVLRMWAIVPGLRGTVTEFTRATFQREMLKGMSPWELRTTLSYCMTKWQAYWEQRNA